MLSTVVILLSVFVAPSYQFANLKLNNAYMSRLQMSTTSASVAILPSLETDKLVIRVAGVDELPQCAGFLSNNMYAAGVPKGQIRELQRLELADLRSRYGSQGRQQVSSVLIVAIEEEEIIGSVSLDCQYFDREKEKFRVIKSNKVVDPNKEVIVVLSNLAVRRDRRKQKIAQKLLQACENYIRDNENWNYEEIYLQVDSENKIAQKLYIKTNYKLIFEDPDASCVAAGEYNLMTRDCTNYCYKKTIKGEGSGGGANPFEAVAGLFGSLFKK